MKKNQLFPLILSVIGMFSCVKNAEELIPEYPVIYKSYLISEPHIKVYTKGGEITLPYLKNTIIQRVKNNLTDLENIDIYAKTVATYLTENTVIVTIDNVEEEKIRFVYENDGITYWEKQDTTGMPVNASAHFLTYKPLYYEEFDVPKVTGYNKAARYKECIYVKKKNDGFEVPVFDYLSKFEWGQFTVLGINNVFNENYLTLIGDNDTIIIQSFIIEMKISSH
jgi:hypothetical protein